MPSFSPFIPPHRSFHFLTWTDIDALPDKANTVIIQPLGAVEQHGPHLPLAVDGVITEGVLGRALTQLPDTIPAYALPPLYYGKSNEHRGFPGTIALTAETVLRTLKEVGQSLYEAGFRKWILWNSHGGQIQVLDIAARDIHEIYPDLQIFPFFTWRLPHSATDLFSAEELTLGIHAGALETSLMMVLLPETVRGDRRGREYPQGIPDPESLLSLEGSLPFAWLTREISASGVLGDATLASAAKGEILLDRLAQGGTQAIAAVYNFRPPSSPRQIDR